MAGITRAKLNLLGISRVFERYTHDERALLASSHRVGYRQRESKGEFFWVTELVPGIAFPSRGRAIAAAETELDKRMGMGIASSVAAP